MRVYEPLGQAISVDQHYKAIPYQCHNHSTTIAIFLPRVKNMQSGVGLPSGKCLSSIGVGT